MTEKNAFGEIPGWLADAKRQWDAIEAEKQTDLWKCQELIAWLRRGLMAAVPAIGNGSPLNEIESLLWEIAVGDLTDKQLAALRKLEMEAGYIADSNGDVFP